MNGTARVISVVRPAIVAATGFVAPGQHGCEADRPKRAAAERR